MKTIKLFLILTLFMSFNSFSKDGNVVTETIEKIDTSHVSKEIYRDVKSVVVSLASGLKTTSEQVLTIYGKHFMLEGVFCLICSIFCAICLFFLFYIRREKGDYFLTKDGVPLFFFHFIFTGLFFIFIYWGICLTFNPEYYVIEEILEKLTKFKN